MKKVYKERLSKLADHLDSGKLGHKKFDFDHWNHVQFGEDFDDKGCGTCGCAIGECPIIFPRQWEFRANFPVLKKIQNQHEECVTPVTKSGTEFFGLEHPEFRHLFTPMGQDTEAYGGKTLSAKARRKSVASNIREFVARQR